MASGAFLSRSRSPGPRLSISADSWVILPDVFEIESLFVHWLLSAPLSATQRRMFCAIDGRPRREVL